MAQDDAAHMSSHCSYIYKHSKSSDVQVYEDSGQNSGPKVIKLFSCSTQLSIKSFRIAGNHKLIQHSQLISCS